MAKTVNVSLSEYEWLKQEHRALSMQVLELTGRNLVLERENMVLKQKLITAQALCDSREKTIDELEGAR